MHSALMNGRYRGVETLSHTGGVMGGNAQMLKVPAAGLDVAIMTNRHDVSGMLLVNEILDSCLPGLDPIRAPSHGPFPTGIFCSPTTGRVIQLCDSSTLPWIKGQRIVSIDSMEMPVEPDKEGVLWPAECSDKLSRQ